ncbi:M14 family zinc carboxypeptidase [Desertibacillus haloalkaliphilus]|uniref:M14 family zinc carboxypeptidase n=1 Tax=Desertibacillus haloalkaliphilus TaxID=1328930 RepID=UPI001C2638A0|nr:M14 family zinc carboxypeptidase [Desertibacillus haloalkaliphilus]MBU8906517.1 Tat (twin-arginine translocation) pathway signal sequence [Desertibacillus haloalkaliphilus]
MKTGLFRSLLALPLVFVLIFTSATMASPAPSTNGKTSMDSIITYDDMINSLDRIVHTSRNEIDVFTLAELDKYEYDKSEQGRDLYVAKVGNGPTKVWVQSRIHGDEPYGTEATLEILKNLGSNGSAKYQEILDELTMYFIPMYNPDGSEMNIRRTILQDEEGSIDLNRDWAEDGFAAKESRAFYEFWADIKPDYAIDIHHQGLKTMYDSDEPVTMSLGISLAPGGPTLPDIEDYDEVTRKMQVHVYDALSKYGHINIDRYNVGSPGNYYEIDIKGGVVSAMMLGLNYNDLNPENHSHPAIFFETSGNTRDGNLGQKSRGALIRQNTEGIEALLTGIANGEMLEADADRWYDIPSVPLSGYFTDY